MKVHQRVEGKLQLGAGGGGVLNKVFLRGGSTRGLTPYPFIYHFRQKKYPFPITSIDK